jgi:uncharacterized Zn-finger protein
MASGSTPHFQNSDGVPVIEIGTKEFMCIGARPPHDHPHIFIDMGALIARRSTSTMAAWLRRNRSRPMPCGPRKRRDFLKQSLRPALLRRTFLYHALIEPALSRQAGGAAGERRKADDDGEGPQHAAAN